MAAANPADGSEDVNDFLRRIRELGDKRDQEDAERTRKLEEDILESRRQREARRAERARSISPRKESPSSTPRSMRSPGSVASPPPSLGSIFSSTREPKLEPPRDTSPTAGELSHQTPQRSPSPSVASSKPSPSAAIPSRSSTLSRSGTLSWQQRPSGPRSRPLSLVESRKNIESLPADVSGDDTPSKDQIAKSLASKDPAWFRQTSDRGLGSAAYRRNPDESSGSADGTFEKRKLHGLSRESTPLETSSDHHEQAISPSDRTTDHATRISDADTADTGKDVKSFSEDAIGHVAFSQKSSDASAPPKQNVFESKPEFLSGASVRSRSGSTSPERFERPASPTKGMGGFVQSAMMRRSDSINKRWSAQPAPGLARQNSQTSMRLGRSGSKDIKGLPHSSNSAPNFGDVPSLASDALQERTDSVEPPAEADQLADESALKSNVANIATPKEEEPEKKMDGQQRPTSNAHSYTPSSSPSKRWSPLKSSWLESALNKPDSPKPKPQAPPSQPSWMVDLNRNRQQRMSRDITAASTTPNSNTNVKDVGASKITGNGSERNQEPPMVDVGAASSSENKTPNHMEKAADITSTQSTTKPLDETSDPPARPISLSTVSIPKSKPVTPPKKDFRSNLKPRDQSPSKAQENEPEFRGAFGKLRHTQTEKYQAPDVLKDNIMRGKAGLATTGGPQKSQRKDELKESLVKQKEAMKAKAADPQASPKISKSRVDPPTPEAIAKKKALGRSDSSGNILGPRNGAPDEKVDATKGATQANSEAANDNLEPALSQKSAPPSTQNQGGLSGKLAGRFNPALANLLARGPPDTSRKTVPSASGDESPLRPSNSASRSMSPSESSTPLEHMTKGRARGPKRRPPKATDKPSGAGEETMLPESVSTPQTLRDRNSAPQNPPQASKLSQSLPSATIPVQTPSRTFPSPTKLTDSPKVQESPKPQTPTKFGTLKLPQDPTSGKSEKESQSTLDNGTAQPSEENTSSPTKLAADSVKTAAARWGRPTTAESSPKTKMPISLPTRAEENARADASLSTADSKSSVQLARDAPRKLPSTDSPRVEAVRAIPSNTSTPSKVAPTPSTNSPSFREKPSVVPKKEALSPPTQTAEATGVFAGFFDVPPVVHAGLALDVQALLEPRQNATPKTNTIRKSIASLTGSGKLEAMPPNQDHVLYSTEMYICTYAFGEGAGSRRTEVYFWVGRDVGASVLEDAHLFARKAAKDAGGELIKIQQGAEPAGFFQALGGVMITRRGPPSTSEDQSFLLCGRRHLGHIAFDEVEFSLGSFCAGFPFIAVPAPSANQQSNSGSSAKPRRIYLWKGAGCNAEELGCARLISMDLIPSGAPSEVTEVEDGKEPAEFLSLFPAPAKQPPGKPKTMPRSADHWKLKARHDKYAVRLFRVESATSYSNTRQPPSSPGGTTSGLWNFMRRGSEHDTSSTAQPPQQTTADGQTVRELVPFSQSDLSPQHIHVLDAFFETYVIVGAQAHSSAASFATALVFAQEYGMLAAGAQDRPFVPVGTVVLQGAPRDMKACFRAWRDDDATPVREVRADAGLARGRSLKIVPLSAAVAAARPPV